MAPSIIEGIDNEVLFVVSVLAAFLTILLVHLVYNSNATNRNATEHDLEPDISSDPDQSDYSRPTDRADESPSQEQGSDSGNIGLRQTTTSSLNDNANEASGSQPGNDREGQRGPTQNTSDAGGQQGPIEELISIRIKFLESEKNLSIDRRISVGELKSSCFQDELNNGRRVRLIYSGRLLEGDSAPVSFYGVGHNSVIHAQISDAQGVSGEHSGRQDDEGLIFSMDPSKLFVPILAFILILCWYGLFNYRHLFSAASVIILIFMTLAFGFLVYVITS